MKIRDFIREDPADLACEAVLAIIKEVARFRIRRVRSSTTEIEITLTIGEFEARVICDLSDLPYFLMNPDPESEKALREKEKGIG